MAEPSLLAKPKKIHLIAIGGAVMHNLALALRNSGHTVQGSDDEIREPSRSRLAAAGLLPEKLGWDPQRLNSSIDLVILGMHAHADNPELQRAQELGLRILSFPELMYQTAITKQRVAIAGSHGKTTTTSMILHVLRSSGRTFDFLVGASIDGFDVMVRVSESAPLLVVEADEYLSSAIDRRPKCFFYRPHISVITGIAWDHMNVFPTKQLYEEQFREFLDTHVEGATVFYSANDAALTSMMNEPKSRRRLELVPYEAHPYRTGEQRTQLLTPAGPIEVPIFGAHNMRNLSAARLVCQKLGVSDAEFYGAMQNFRGAKLRLEIVRDTDRFVCIRDFAHAPSKVRASTEAVREQYADRKLVVCFELHTFSSLNKEFLPQYKGSLAQADAALVYFDPHVVALKRLEAIEPEEIRRHFGMPQLTVVTKREDVEAFIRDNVHGRSALLMMSSGNFGGIDFDALG